MIFHKEAQKKVCSKHTLQFRAVALGLGRLSHRALIPHHITQSILPHYLSCILNRIRRTLPFHHPVARSLTVMLSPIVQEALVRLELNEWFLSPEKILGYLRASSRQFVGS